MPWFKVDDRLYSHPKLAALEAGKHFAEAVALWCIAGSWCASQLTDGSVPTTQLRRLVPFDARKAAAELVRVRLWDETDDGYVFRSWAEYQPSRDDVEAKRNAATERVRAYRAKRNTRDGNADVTRYADVGNASVTPPPTRPDPTRPVESATHSPAGVRDKSPDARRADRLRLGYLERFAKATPIKPPAQAQPGGGGPWLDLARDLTDEQCGPFLDAYFADDWCKGGGFKLGALASERVRLLTAGPTVAGQAAPLALVRSASPELAAALEAQERAEEACRKARLHRDSVAGTEAHSEASRAHSAKQRELAMAKDRVEALSA